MALYGISATDVAQVVEGIPDLTDGAERSEVINHGFAGKFGYPLKVVYSKEHSRVTVITAYPVKRELKRQ